MLGMSRNQEGMNMLLECPGSGSMIDTLATFFYVPREARFSVVDARHGKVSLARCTSGMILEHYTNGGNAK